MEVSKDIIICQGQEAPLHSKVVNDLDTFKFEWSPKEFLNRSDVPSPIARPQETITYYIKVTDGCRKAVDSVTITVAPFDKPDVIVTGNNPMCIGDSVILSVDPYKDEYMYLWSTGDTTRQITVFQGGEYTIKVESAEGCNNQASIHIDAFEIPEAEIEAQGPTTFCEGGFVTLDALPYGEGFNYTWSNGLKCPALTVDESGTYSVIVEVAEGCKDSASIVVNVIPTPDVKITPDRPPSLCKGDSVVLAASPYGAEYRLLWSTGSTDPEIIVKTSGTYKVIIENAFGCRDSAEITVEVHQALEVEIIPIGPAKLCEGDSVVLGTSPYGAEYSLLWSTGSTDPEIVVKASGYYKVIIENSFGCRDSAEITIDICPLPEIKILGDAVFCQGESAVLRAVPDRPGNNYEWSSGETTHEIEVNKPGVYIITVLDLNGCAALDSIVIKQYPPPELSVNGPTELCSGNSVLLSVDREFPAYAWSNGDTTRSVLIGEEGVYEVIVVDSNGCIGAASIEVEQIDVEINLDALNNIDIGPVCVGNESEKTVMLGGNGNFRIARASMQNGGGISIQTIPPTPAEITAGDSIAIIITFRPEEARDYINSLILEISEPCPIIKKTAVVGAGKASVIVWIPTDIKGTPGEEGFCIPLKAKLNYDGGPVSGLSYKAEIRFDANAFLPDAPTIGKVVTAEDGSLERVLNISGGGAALTGAETTLEEICGVILLSRNYKTELRITEFEWNDGDICIDTSHGELQFEAICAPSLRRIRTFIPTSLTAAPNPAEEYITVEANINTKGRHSIILMNIQGGSSELFNWDVRENGSKKYEFNFNAGAYANGMYYIVLRSPTMSKAAPVFILR